MTERRSLHNGALTFVGFGFGAIQAGLFGLEVLRSGNFRRLVIAEVLPQVVTAVRQEKGEFGLNVAYRDRIESLTLGLQVRPRIHSHDVHILSVETKLCPGTHSCNAKLHASANHAGQSANRLH